MVQRCKHVEIYKSVKGTNAFNVHCTALKVGNEFKERTEAERERKEEVESEYERKQN